MLILGSFHEDFHWPFLHDLLKICELFGHHVNLREISSKIGSIVYPIFLIQALCFKLQICSVSLVLNLECYINYTRCKSRQEADKDLKF